MSGSPSQRNRQENEMNRRTFLRTLAEVAGAASLAGVATPSWAAEKGGSAPLPDRLRLAAVGDCILGHRFMENGDAEVRAVADLLRNSDAAWGNYERVQPDPQAADSLAALAAWPAAELRALGLRLAGTANNHALDYGDEGLFALMESLDHAGIAHAGAGADLAQAARPAIYETRTGRIADVNCASTFPDCFPASPSRSYRKGRPGINPLHVDATVQVDRDLFARLKQVEAQLARLEAASEAEALAGEPEGGKPDLATVEGVTFQAGPGIERLAVPRPGDLTRVTQAIRSARQDARVVIASIHSHEARNVLEQPAAFLPRFAHACIDAGADLFVGAGPHVLRGIELYKGRPIFYSLGNFIFHFYGEKVGFRKQRRFWQSVVPRLTWEGHRLVAVDLHPITLGFGQPEERRGTPHLAHGEEAREILVRVSELSRPYGTIVEIDGEVGRLRLG